MLQASTGHLSARRLLKEKGKVTLKNTLNSESTLYLPQWPGLIRSETVWLLTQETGTQLRQFTYKRNDLGNIKIPLLSCLLETVLGF